MLKRETVKVFCQKLMVYKVKSETATPSFICIYRAAQVILKVLSEKRQFL